MTVEELFSLYNPEVRAVAKKARALVLDVFPNAVEQVDAPDKMLHYGTGPKMNEQLFYIAGYTAHVNVGFWYGAHLPDPEGIVEGTGKRLRHVKLRKPEDVYRPALRALLEAALAGA
jgi:hypothetical protein